MLFFTLRWRTEEVQPSWFGLGTHGVKWNGPDPGATSELPHKTCEKKIKSRVNVEKIRSSFVKHVWLEG